MQARIIHKAVSFEMTVESNYAIVIAIATLRDWLENRAPVFQPMRGKTNRTLYRRFSRALSKLQVIVRIDWFIALFAPVVIGR